MKANAYNFSNDLARIGGALKNAFIGSASDDANIALAKYRDSQTADTQQNTEQTGLVNDAVNSLAKQPVFQNFIANAMQLDTIPAQFMGPPSSSEMRTGTPAASNLAQAFLGSGGNAQQMASAASTYGDATASRLFEAMVRDGSPDDLRRGAIGMGMSPTKYFDAGTAQTEIANDLTASLDKNAQSLAGTMYTADQTLTGQKYEDDARFGPDGQGDRNNIRDNATTKELGLDLNAAKERWAKYKSDQEKLATDNKTEVDAGVARDKNQMANETARYKHDTRTVEFSVEPGKIIVVDPVSAKKANIPIQTEGKYEGLHILDGGLNLNNGVKVTVGQADVIVTKEVAEALGIPKVNGQYRVKGAGYNSGSSTSGSSGSSDFTVSPSDDKALREFIVGQDTDGAIEGMSNASTIMNELVKMSVAAMGNKKNIPNAKAFITEKLSKGFVDLVVPIPRAFDDKFKVPVYLIDEINGNTGNQANDQQIQTLKAQSPDQWREIATGVLSEHGFSADRIAIILGQ